MADKEGADAEFSVQGLYSISNSQCFIKNRALVAEIIGSSPLWRKTQQVPYLASSGPWAG